jgi:hypothetical protein
MRRKIARLAAALALCAVGSVTSGGSRVLAAQNPVHGTPEEIERYKQELAERIRADRTHAKRGDVFNPELTRFLLSRFRRIAEGKDGKKVLPLIQESNPGDLPSRSTSPIRKRSLSPPCRPSC